ncbi:MAG: stalk domain-containing protein [Clostridia bacterium]|nr:stalk domain-containing protein [Clostridia bacterium]
MKRKVFLQVVFAVITALLLSTSVFAVREVKVEIDGQTVALSVKPIIEKGRVLVPISSIADKLGAKVTWEAKERTIWINKGMVNVELPIGKKEMYIHRDYDFSGIPQVVKLDVAAKVIKGKAFVPMGAIAEYLDMDVSWDKKNYTIVLKKKADITPVEQPVSFKDITSEDIKNNAKLYDWYQRNHKSEGIHFTTDDKTVYVLVSGGEKPTGGYKIEVDSVTMVEPGSAYVSAYLIKPAPDMMVTQAITYPHALIKFEGENIKEVRGDIQDQGSGARMIGKVKQIGAGEVESIKLFNLEQKMVKELSGDEVAKIVGCYNESVIDDTSYIEMIAGNMMVIALKNGSAVTFTSYGSQTNVVAGGELNGDRITYHLICPEIAKMLLEKY